MRFGRRFLANMMADAAEATVETRDAIVWEVLPAQRICRCKIQGSDEPIVAWYPENWAQTPSWLKPQNGVILRHTAGLRDRMEVIGHGQLVPTPIAGGAAPAPAVAEDCILTGCQLAEISADLQMAVFVWTGTLRITGTVYTLGPIAMSDTTLLDMGMEAPIEVTAEVVGIDAAPAAGQFRYDLVVVGADLVVDYVKGTAAASSPVMPAVPASHVKCGHILVVGGATQINQADINRMWVAPAATTLTMAITDDDLAWTELSTTITISVLDQDGNPIYQTGYGWQIELSIISGNGEVSFGSSSSTSAVTGNSGPSSNQVAFTYTRDQQDPGDISPMLQAAVSTTLLTVGFIILRDSSGDIMI